MRGDRGAGTKQLFSKHTNLFSHFGQLDKEPNNAGSVTLCTVPEFLWQSAIHFSFLLSAFRISAFYFPNFSFSLNGVHKRPLDVVEEDDAEEKNASDDPGTEAQVAPTEQALAKIGIAEGFEERGHGVHDHH